MTSELQFPITNEEAVAMGYTLAEMIAAERALDRLWSLVRRGYQHDQ